jgi:hypothetical protein
MSLDVSLHIALQHKPSALRLQLAPVSQAHLRLCRNGFAHKLHEFAQLHAKPLDKPLILSVCGTEFRITADAFGQPLTFLTPDQLDLIHDEHPMNETALDYIRHHDFRHILIVIPHWE